MSFIFSFFRTKNGGVFIMENEEFLMDNYEDEEDYSLSKDELEESGYLDEDDEY
jgi:hypothetical protein